MTKTEALYKFFSSFGLTAYPTTAVPEDVVFPWLTYEPVVGNFGDTVSITVNIWYHTSSEAVLNNKAEEIAQAITEGGKTLSYDNGIIVVRRGNPWCTPLADSTDNTVKQRMLNIDLDYL